MPERKTGRKFESNQPKKPKLLKSQLAGASNKDEHNCYDPFEGGSSEEIENNFIYVEGFGRVPKLTERDRELIDKGAEVFFRTKHPEWDDDTIARVVERAEIVGLAMEYEALVKNPDADPRAIKFIEKEIGRRRKNLGDDRIP